MSVAARLATAESFEADAEVAATRDFLVARVLWNPLRGGTETEFVAVRGAETRRYRLFVRLPAFTELRGWLLDAGFSHVDGFGEDGEPLHQDHRRMVAVAYA